MKIIECPRDAMQGLEKFVDTDLKASYINRLLKVGFDTIDFGSFVSEKAIPQMRDTAQLITKLDDSPTKLLAIIANKRGAIDACSFDRINYLGFPFSISEEFQKRNTNKTIEQSLISLSEIQELAFKNNKSLVVYLSMAFGNPYNEKWHEDMVALWAEKVIDLGINTLALSDTIGVSNKSNIRSLFQLLTTEFPKVEWGAHLHTTKDSWKVKVESAYNSGCRRFDAAIMGFGGCPMANDALVGNLATESLISFLHEKKIDHSINTLAFESAYNKSLEIFNHH
ncbi:MAG: hydroxymethylglutaryl-CoA lyase [Flavobacteriales bacterium]|jgi:hydroxymethylglutaryl-CoA lyase